MSLLESPGSLKGAVADLEALMSNLTPKDKTFADSLINGPYGYKKRGYLSAKQEPYIFSLLERAMGSTVGEKSGKDLGVSVEGIAKIFEKAKGKLKYPTIVFETTFGKVKIWVQGEKAKYPGSIAVTLDGVWMGRVHPSGWFETSHGFNIVPGGNELVNLLGDLATKPEETAAHYGKLSCKCVFCQTPLTDPKSLAVGYGPTCAENYGLKWGVAEFSMKDVAA